jgi:hypothetical protein
VYKIVWREQAGYWYGCVCRKWDNASECFHIMLYFMVCVCVSTYQLWNPVVDVHELCCAHCATKGYSYFLFLIWQFPSHSLLILLWYFGGSNAYKCTALLMFRRICSLPSPRSNWSHPQVLFSSLRSDEPPAYITKLISHTYLDPEDGGRIFLQLSGTAAHFHTYQNLKTEETGST